MIKLISRPILITGVAGFIGAALAKRLLTEGKEIIGIDNLNSYYDPFLKELRIKDLLENYSKSFFFHKVSIENSHELEKIFTKYNPNIVINLAAQAGVRHSIDNPLPYLQSNLIGFFNILELCRKSNIENFIYASSSSVYGGNRKLPFSENHSVDHPVSFYAATKKSNELMAHSYSHLYGIPSTGLRFFTVYGPWGRPDMAPMIFAKSIVSNKTIKVFNYGNMERDFTYIEDVVEAVTRCCYKPATANKNFNCLSPENSSSFAPHRIFNVGNSIPVKLLKFIELLENELGIKAKKEFMPIQAGDVISTASDTDCLKKWIDYSPVTTIEKGVKSFVDWFFSYYCK